MKLIVMLEDDLERIERMSQILAEHGQVELVVSRTAHDFTDRYSALGKRPDLIALDHDLFPDAPDQPDPGDGRDVAQYWYPYAMEMLNRGIAE